MANQARQAKPQQDPQPRATGFGAEVAGYRVLRADTPPCPHLSNLRVGKGDSLPIWLLPTPCEACYGRFAEMVTAEAEAVFGRCIDNRVLLAEVPPAFDPWRGKWHLNVGSRVRSRGLRAAAFVLETPRTTMVVATIGLWGGPNGLLKRYWHQEEVGDLREHLQALLASRSVTRGEMFFRQGFYEHMVPVGAERAVLLVEEEMLELLRQLAG
jgi:hypothetical protein